MAHVGIVVTNEFLFSSLMFLELEFQYNLQVFLSRCSLFVRTEERPRDADESQNHLISRVFVHFLELFEFQPFVSKVFDWFNSHNLF